MPQNSLESSAFEVEERGWFCVPSPLVSRERVVRVSTGVARGLVRGAGAVREVWRSAPGSSAWVEVQAGVGPARVLVRLEAPVGERLPERYRIESDDGGSGWRPELEVVGNAARTRAHLIEFDGQSAVRVVFDELGAGGQAALARIDVHDASNGADDVWLVLGDALAGAGLSEQGGARGFAPGVHASYPGYFPALIDESQAGETPAGLLARLGSLLEVHAHARRVALSFDSTPAGADAAALGELAAALLAAGRIPLFARAPVVASPPAAEVAAFNARLAELELEHGLPRGPDPSAWAEAWRRAAAAPGSTETPVELPVEACDALSALWVEAADVFYVPQ